MLRKRNSNLQSKLLFLCAGYPFCYISDEPLARSKNKATKKMIRIGD